MQLFLSFALLVYPDGWYLQGNALYKYFSVQKTWQNAREFCRSIDAELAYIPNQELNKFVYRNLLEDVKLENGKLKASQIEVISYNDLNFQSTNNFKHSSRLTQSCYSCRV